MIRIYFAGGRRNFRPREQVTIGLEWSFDSSPGELELRLLWFTQGKGTDETKVIGRQSVPGPAQSGRQQFTFVLPESPYSFQGKLIRLVWAVEAFTGGTGECEREEFTMSPTGQEVQIGRPDA